MKKRVILFFAVILYGMVWAQTPSLDLQLEIGSQGGQIQITGSVATNLDYLLLCSSNLTDWTIAADLTSLSGDSFDYVETNRASCLFYKRICSRVKGTSFVTTGNPSAPAAAVMADGSMIAVLVDSNDVSRVTGALYSSTNGESLLMELGTNGMPRTITSGNSVFYFRDWTQDTVDVWWIQTNGTRQVFEDVLFRGASAAADPLVLPVALAEPVALAADGEEDSVVSDVQELLDIALIGLDIGTCAISVATVGVSGGATVPVAILSCSAAGAGLVELMFDEPWAGGAGALFSLASAVANPEVVFIESLIAALEIGNASLGILLSINEDAEGVITEIEASYCILPPEGMVFIQSGTNTGTNPLGLDYWGDPESYTSIYPEHYSLTVDAFFMDQHEVSNDKMIEVMQWAYDNGKLIVSAATVKNAEGSQQELLNLDGRGCRIVWDAGSSTFAMKATKGSGYPCVHVSVYGAMAYCNYLAEMHGRTPCYNLVDWSCDLDTNGYRLPSNEEWEYAARGGLVGKRYPWGDTIAHINANYTADGDEGSPPVQYDLSLMQGRHPLYDDGEWPYTCPVNSFVPNDYGLYCMAGNVREFAVDYPVSGMNNIAARGGDWEYLAQQARCGERWNVSSLGYFLDPIIGFRVVCK